MIRSYKWALLLAVGVLTGCGSFERYENDPRYKAGMYNLRLNVSERPIYESRRAAESSALRKMRMRVIEDNVATRDDEMIGQQYSSPIVPVGKRYALIIGVASYADSRVPVLRYAAQDAREFYKWAVSQKGGRYAPGDVQILVNEDATGENIRDALFNWARQALPEDILTIYMACHGTPESPDSEENLFLLPYDTDYANMAATAFPMWDIKTALERFVKAKRVVIIADVCHSGGIGEPFTIARRGVSGIAPSMLQKGVSDLAGVREGVLVFSSAQGGQLSQEGAQWGGGHGVFTYYLLDGLKGAADYDSNGSVTLGELVPYVQEKVRRETRDAQTPQASGRYDTNLSIAR